MVCVLTPWRRKPRYLLQPNELKEVFGEPEFGAPLSVCSGLLLRPLTRLAVVVHEYTEATLPDRRPVAFLCAQRKQAS